MTHLPFGSDGVDPDTVPRDMAWSFDETGVSTQNTGIAAQNPASPLKTPGIAAQNKETQAMNGCLARLVTRQSLL